MIGFILDIPREKNSRSIAELFVKKPSFSQTLHHDTFEFAAWGDPIADEGFAERMERVADPGSILAMAKGHYCFIHLNKRENRLWIGNSLFSILPVYYWENRDRIVLADNALAIGEYLKMHALSRRFVLETTLFQYPLFDITPIEGVMLLPSNSTIIITPSGLKIEKHTRIEDSFAARPFPWKESVNEMSELFLQTVSAYLPNQHYATSLTGGFDGRALTAAGLHSGKKFSCYAFGSRDSEDIPIASGLAEEAGIPFIQIDLDEDYAKNKSLDCGLEFIRGASGTATFARAHYLHAAKLLASRTEHIVTGDFGSEILRAAHVTGAVIAPNLHRLFDSNSPDEAFRMIASSAESRFLNLTAFTAELEALRADLSRLPCFNKSFDGLTRNQRFYVFVFEEVFRKYFGAEIVNQFHFLRNRTPFLDMDFLRALFKTTLAGVHSGYFEHNPLKRYKGQIFYAHVIQKAYPAFADRLTDKGYMPGDLLSLKGRMRIALHYAQKTLGRTRSVSDPFAVFRAFTANQGYFSGMPIDPRLFHARRIRDEIEAHSRESVFIPLSLSYLQSKVEE